MDLFDLSNNILSDIIKYAVLHLCTYIAYTKLVNYKEKSKKLFVIKFIGLIVCSIVLSYIYAYINLNINPFLPFIVSWLGLSILITFFTHKKFINTLLITIPAFLISIGAWLISALIMSAINVYILEVDVRTFWNYIVMDLLIIIFTLLFLRIKKFKNGSLALQKDDVIENVGIFGITISGIIIYLFYTFKSFQKYQDLSQCIVSLFLLVLLGICSYVLHKKSQDLSYKDILRDRNNEMLGNELETKDKELTRALEEAFRISQISHAMNHRIRILENIASDMASIPAVTKKFKKKYGKDFDVFLKDTKQSSQEYLDAVSNIGKKRELPLTHIFEIDTAFEYLQAEAQRDKIILELKINDSVNYMIDKKFITINQLRTLLCDHIEDSMKAIKSSKTQYRKIFVLLGKLTSNYYGIKIYDSGIEFPINILTNIGLKAVTSYKDGTGQGFMTTFKAINNIKGSIVIEENNPKESNYTKSVGILFDGKGEYRINSYRANIIKKADNNGRIIIKKEKNKK